jgi:hypothetical protein
MKTGRATVKRIFDGDLTGGFAPGSRADSQSVGARRETAGPGLRNGPSKGCLIETRVA